MPRWDGARRKTPEELFALAMSANSALGGSVQAGG